MNSFYQISRGVLPGKTLTTAQRTSSLFAEEPTVMGKVLRRGSAPLQVSEELFEHNRVHLMRLEKAGSIVIAKPERASEEPPEAPIPSDPAQIPTPPGGVEIPETPELPSTGTPMEPPGPTEEPTEPPVVEEPSTPPPPVEQTAPAALKTDNQSRKKNRKE